MPTKSPAQSRLMRAIAHGWTPSRMKNPPSQAVAQEFVTADKRVKGYQEGGSAQDDQRWAAYTAMIRALQGPIDSLQNKALAAGEEPGGLFTNLFTGLQAKAEAARGALDPGTLAAQPGLGPATGLFAPGAREGLGQVGGLEAIQQRYLAPPQQGEHQAGIMPGRQLIGFPGQTPPAPTGGSGPSQGPSQGQYGGAPIPASLKGYLQRMRMEARQGQGQNRIGSGDQRGGLARAKQSQTGRPPISRRSAFPGRAR